MTSSILLCLFVCLAGGALACPDGFFSHGPSCYLIPFQVATWPEAKVYCQAVGADLAAIESQAEQDALAGYLKIHAGTYTDNFFWLDGADYAEEGVWQWTTAAKRISPSFWAPGHPDGDSAEQCLHMWAPQDYLWSDFNCEAKAHFVCELPNEDIPVVG